MSHLWPKPGIASEITSSVEEELANLPAGAVNGEAKMTGLELRGTLYQKNKRIVGKNVANFGPQYRFSK